MFPATTEQPLTEELETQIPRSRMLHGRKRTSRSNKSGIPHRKRVSAVRAELQFRSGSALLTIPKHRKSEFEAANELAHEAVVERVGGIARQMVMRVAKVGGVGDLDNDLSSYSFTAKQ